MIGVSTALTQDDDDDTFVFAWQLNDNTDMNRGCFDYNMQE